MPLFAPLHLILSVSGTCVECCPVNMDGTVQCWSPFCSWEDWDFPVAWIANQEVSCLLTAGSWNPDDWLTGQPREKEGFHWAAYESVKGQRGAAQFGSVHEGFCWAVELQAALKMHRNVRRTSQAKLRAIEEVGEGVKLVCLLMLTAMS